MMSEKTPSPAGPVVKLLHGLAPSETAAILRERLLPVIGVSVAAAVYEFLKFPICNFKFVQQVLWQFHGVSVCPLKTPARNPHHIRWNAAFRVQRETDDTGLYWSHSGCAFYGFISFFGYLPPIIPKWDSDVLHGRYTKEPPVTVHVSILLEVNVGAGRRSLDRNWE